MTDGIPGDQTEDFSREAFMAAIVKLADDETFRRSFLTHYQLFLHPPMIVNFDPAGLNMDPGGITFLSEAQIAARAQAMIGTGTHAPLGGGLRLQAEWDESRANIERLIRDSGGAP